MEGGAEFAVDLVHRYRVSPTTEERTQHRPGLRPPATSGWPSAGPGWQATIRTQNLAFQLDYVPQPYGAPHETPGGHDQRPAPLGHGQREEDRPEEATQLLLFLSGEYTQGLITDLQGTTPVPKKLQASASATSHRPRPR